MSKTTLVFIGLAILALLSLIGRLLTLFRQSRAIEKTLDYSKMETWEEDDDWPARPADDAESPADRSADSPSDPRGT